MVRRLAACSFVLISLACGGLFAPTEHTDLTFTQATALGYTPPEGAANIDILQYSGVDVNGVWMHAELSAEDQQALRDSATSLTLHPGDPPADWPGPHDYGLPLTPDWWQPTGERFYSERPANFATGSDQGIGNQYIFDATAVEVWMFSFQIQWWGVEREGSTEAP